MKLKKIALLFTIVCVGQLYGMEPIEPTYHTLPKELQKEIINTALATSKSIDEVVNTIKALGTLHEAHYSTETAMDLFIKTLPNDLDNAINAVKNLQGITLQDFTKLVHVLADKFGITTSEVAQKINTPTATTYFDLGKRLSHGAKAGHNCIIELINDGADVNFSQYRNYYTPLFFALNNQFNVEVIKTLLNAGAKPTNKDLNLLDDLGTSSPDNEARKNTIKQLLEEAIKK